MARWAAAFSASALGVAGGVDAGGATGAVICEAAALPTDAGTVRAGAVAARAAVGGTGADVAGLDAS